MYYSVQHLNESRVLMDKINKLRETCRRLEIDIQELTSEIIESQLSLENLLEELKIARRELYSEVETYNNLVDPQNPSE